MAREGITLAQVAQQAGVSESAVSRYFTPGASVSDRTAEKVRRAAEALGYRPNVLARSLITGRSRIIAVVLAYLENQFYPDALEKLSAQLEDRGYHILIFLASPSGSDIESRVDEMLDYQVDGIVTASVALSSNLAERCDAAGIPVVMFNRRQDDARFSAVTSDNYTGGRKLADFLVAGGHRRIGYIAGWEGASTQRDRESGFRAGLAAHGLDLAARAVGEFDYDTARRAALELFAGDDRPEAVFVANDHMAFAVMDALRYELGLAIPDDVSVVGYDDVPLAAWPSYDLTTLRQPSNRMVEATVEALMARIEADDPTPRRVSIDGPLIVRRSARGPAPNPAGEPNA